VAKGPGGIISGGFQPLKAPDAPTIDSVSAGVLSADVTFSAPADTGAGSVDSYVITAKQSDGTSVSQTASAAGTASLTLTAGGTTTFAAQAISNAFGPGAFSGFGNSTSVFSGNQLYMWGVNNNGSIGDNTTVNASSPVQVGGTVWSQLAAADSHTIAIQTNNSIWAWGRNATGQLGQDDTTFKSSPVQIGALTNWSKISGGRPSNSHSLSVKTDGTLWGWGANSNGQLGDNSTINASSPIQIGSATNWNTVSAGGRFSLATTTDNELYLWGRNLNGEIGDGTTVARSSPVQLGGTDWSAVSAGYSHCLAVKTNGTLWSWGVGSFGPLGQNDTIKRSSPVQVGALTNWLHVSGGTFHSLAIKTDGTLWGWGRNTAASSAVGDGTVINRSSPVQIGALTNWTDIAAGNETSLGIESGKLYAWGYNGAGKLGDGTVISRSSPVQIGASSNWSQVSGSERTLGALLKA